MPLRALSVETKKSVISFWFKSSNEARFKHPKGFICPGCKQKMYVRGGGVTKFQTHFAHTKSLEQCFIAQKTQSTPKDLTHHTLAVQQVYNWLLPQLPEGFSMEPEYFDPKVPDRIADIGVLDSNGSFVQAVEIQLTKISIERLEARTDSYENAGIEVLWFFGKGCDQEDIRMWSHRRFGCYLLPEFDFRSTEFAELSAS